MRRLYYAGGNMLLADSICQAVLRYASALADVNRADLVMVPVVTEGGSLADAQLLLGPASQLFSTPVENSREEPVDAEVVADLEARTSRLQPSRPAWPSDPTDATEDFELGLDYPDLEAGSGTA